jgi:CDP-paratose 2-epimerase
VRILITGACGFVGSVLARTLLERRENITIYGVDNLSRLGSELNRAPLRELGVRLNHGDLRLASDVSALPRVDWVVDAAANPSVLAGAIGDGTSRQLMEHNLGSTINLLEYCRSFRAGFVLLSTSRVYSIPALAGLPVESCGDAFRLTQGADLPPGITAAGISESFSTAAPISLYGASKLASEALALEYGATFDFPVWINRCGVLAGGGQFGKCEQGIFSYWIHSHFRGRALKYLGFDGRGQQVRDCLHPRDLASLLLCQIDMGARAAGVAKIINVSGGAESARSLRQLTEWCNRRFVPRNIASDPTPRPFDLPWVILDHRLATETWQWRPTISVENICDEVACHAEANPTWLQAASDA